VIVAAADRALFSVGAADAYQGGAHIISITRLEITPPGSQAAIALRLRLAASRPAGKAIPIGVTALHASHGSQAGQPCTRGSLKLHERFISPQTGEHGFILVFHDRAAPCTLRGRPRVGFVDRSNVALPLAITGVNQYVPVIRPRAVRLTRGRNAYVLVAKYRCDPREAQTATVARVLLPSSKVPMNVRVRSVDISLCVGSPTGPGQSIAISPFVAKTRQFEPSQPGP
jgi:hypothetical protein